MLFLFAPRHAPRTSRDRARAVTCGKCVPLTRGTLANLSVMAHSSEDGSRASRWLSGGLSFAASLLFCWSSSAGRISGPCVSTRRHCGTRFSVFPWKSPLLAVYRLFTSPLAHANIGHIIFNMVTLVTTVSLLEVWFRRCAERFIASPLGKVGNTLHVLFPRAERCPRRMCLLLVRIPPYAHRILWAL